MAWLTAGPVAAAPHAPGTSAERALDRIFKVADKDDAQLDNLFDGRGEKRFRRTVDYRLFLTAPLLAHLAKVERDEVRKACGGRYRAGEICGLDYSPITCGQDTPERYLYDTRQDTGATAIVESSTAADGRLATYQLIRKSGRWKINAVHCAVGSGGAA